MTSLLYWSIAKTQLNVPAVIERLKKYRQLMYGADWSLSWRLGWLVLILVVLLTLPWLSRVSQSQSAINMRKASTCSAINRLTSAEFIAQFDRSLTAHWQHSAPLALQWARQYRVSARLTAVLTPQRTGVNLVAASYWHLTRVIETLTSLLVKNSDHVLIVPGDIAIDRLKVLLLDRLTACEYPIVVVKNSPDHALTEQARDLFEALLDDSLAELRVQEQIVHPQQLLIIFATTLADDELTQLRSHLPSSAAVDITQGALSSSQYATDVLQQTRQIHALQTARGWSHRFLQRIRHTVLLLDM